ncbi:MAG: c-type cytochrome [Arenicellales bacterium]|nr:c-type cytochrome [Arenicellales bacterium]
MSAMVQAQDAGSNEQPETTQQDARRNSELGQGKNIYQIHCALCHGKTGEGYIADNAPALSNQDFLASVSDQFLWRSIANGRPGTPMAAHAERYNGPLKDAEIDLLVTLMRSWQQEESVSIPTGHRSGNVEVGQAEFTEHCAECHGQRGEGVTAVSLNNPEFLASASDGQIRWAILQGRRGTPMVAFRNQLSEQTVDNLVALIRSWQQDIVIRVTKPVHTSPQNVVINPEGSSPKFKLRAGRYVSAEQVDEAMQKGERLIILDARPTSNWDEGRIPGAISAPHHDAASTIDRLPRDGTWIVSYCACPHAYSDKLTDELRRAGFMNTAVLDEGVAWWEKNDYPMEY